MLAGFFLPSYSLKCRCELGIMISTRSIMNFHGASKCCPPTRFVQTYALNGVAKKDFLWQLDFIHGMVMTLSDSLK